MVEKTAVIYARYSSEKQTYQSIEGQLKVCYKYAEDNKYTVLPEPYIYIDEAQSGKTDKRDNFRRMLNDSKKKLFDTVIVYAFDRFGRNILQSLLNEKTLTDNGVALLSATENSDSTPSGKMQRNIHMTFAQYYSEELAQKTIRGLELNADNCYSTGGPVPLGYKLEPVGNGKKRYVVDEEMAPVVREIFTKYANGDSIKSICDNLNARQIRTSTGAIFNKNSLHWMMKSRKYIGFYIYGKIEKENGFPRIIDDELFNKVQDKMALNKALPARSRAIDEYLLTTKLFCGYDKEMMVGHSSNKINKNGIKYNYYKCKKQGGGGPCKRKMVHKNYIEDRVIAECRKILTPKYIKRTAREIMKIAESYDDKTEVRRLEKLLQEAQEAKVNHMATLRACNDDTVREMVIEDLSTIAAEIKEFEKQLALENARRETISEAQIIKSLTRLADGDVNSIEYRRSLVRLLVNKIYLYDDKFNIAFNTGDEKVEITEVLLENIEKRLNNGSGLLYDDKGFCPLNSECQWRAATGDGLGS